MVQVGVFGLCIVVVRALWVRWTVRATSCVALSFGAAMLAAFCP